MNHDDELIIVDGVEMFLTYQAMTYMKPELDIAVEEIDCADLAIKTKELEEKLKPFKIFNGIHEELTWLFEFFELRKAEELEERGGLLSV
ncbi:hypothetical protein WNY58_16640 [Neptuniibacter pectenicola]|uniref:Uncharacterized protein n=1 Tax=Neptuniibacter pectenicola TaxID=1806669 RepID=A0ABU9TWC3_9GAMM